MKAVDIEGVICIKHDGDFVPSTEAERENAGTNKIIEEMCLSRARRSLYLHNISTMKGRQARVPGMRWSGDPGRSGGCVCLINMRQSVIFPNEQEKKTDKWIVRRSITTGRVSDSRYDSEGKIYLIKRF